MANLRVRILINEGREGAPLDKLGQIADAAERFLRLLAHDVGISIPKGEWVAENFKNGSIFFDAMHLADYDLSQVSLFNRGIDDVTRFDPDQDRVDGVASAETIRQFARIADPLSIDDRVSFGVYEPDADEPDRWHPLTKSSALKIAKKLDEVVEYQGSIQGKMHALFASDFYFKLRHALGGELINCYFERELYNDVINALARQEALVYVWGRVRVRRADRAVNSVDVSFLKIAPTLSDSQYNA
ncbi:MAG: hypothetical protein RLZZ501_2769, partial [Pseudomonadota bacterium]